MIRNLNLHLAQFSKDRICFIVLENFQEINIGMLETPVTLRRPIPIVHRYKNGMSTVYKIILGTALYNFSSLENSSLLSCLPSKYLVYTCLQINLPKYFHRIKPFSCQIHIGMFPTASFLQHEQNWIYPKIFEVSLQYFPRYFATPSSIPSINGVIQLPEKYSPFNHFATQKIWLTNLGDTSSASYTHDVYIIFTSPVTRQVDLTWLQEPVCHISMVEVLKICQECEIAPKEPLGTVIRSSIKFVQHDKLIQLGHADPNERLIIQSEPYTLGKNVLAFMIGRFGYLRSCIQKNSRTLRSSISAENSIPQKVAVAHSDVWKSILRNFTFLDKYKYMDNDVSECALLHTYSFPINLEQTAYPKSILMFPYFIQDTLNSLRFVGCGQQGLSSLPFQEFTIVFDKVIWLSILITIVMVPVGMKFLRMENNMNDTVTSFLKVFLEQGTPFQAATANTKQLRYIVVPVLLVGIVLSNAYKNTNVYNMVVPRKPILYKHFQELICDNFNIYSRSTFSKSYSGMEPPHKMKLGKYYFRVAGNWIFLQSEVEKLIQNYLSLTLVSNGIGRNDKTLVDSGVKDTITLHPEFARTFNDLLHEKVVGQPPSTQHVIKYFPEFQVWEEKLFRRSIEKCKKTAVVLPDHICRKLYVKLLKMEKGKYIFIGKESFSDIDWAYSFKGIIPPHLILRIRRIGASVVWKWWMELLSGKTSNDAESNTVLATNMGGNIIIIFIMWTFGVVMAFSCASLEWFCNAGKQNNSHKERTIQH